MRFWWVNHKQTARQELDGGYLWSPITEKRGVRSQFYDNMRIAKPGDVVLSFSYGQISHIGRVQDFANPAPKPINFGKAGENWGDNGWILPVIWKSLPLPVRPKTRIADLGPLLPTKYSPIHPVSGNGNQKAYLAEISREVVELLTGIELFENESEIQEAGPSYLLNRIDNALEEGIEKNANLNSTTKEQLILARRGQGLFKRRIFDYEQSCRLTKVDNPELLIASHIKPWRTCASVEDRLDGSNGLLLTPHVDLLFGKGLISFSNVGEVLLSTKLRLIDLNRLGLHDACMSSCGPFHENQQNFLNFHRDVVFLK